MSKRKKEDNLTAIEREELIKLRMKRVDSLDEDIKVLKKCVNVCADGIMKNETRIKEMEKKLGLEHKEQTEDKVQNYVG